MPPYEVSPKKSSFMVLGIKLSCQHCGTDFLCCKKCWRGHRYCSVSCRTLSRKLKQRSYEKKYSNTFSGQESRRKRQACFQQRLKKIQNITEQSIFKKKSHAKQSQQILKSEILCSGCHYKITQIIKESDRHDEEQFSYPNQKIYFSFNRFFK